MRDLPIAASVNVELKILIELSLVSKSPSLVCTWILYIGVQAKKISGRWLNLLPNSVYNNYNFAGQGSPEKIVKFSLIKCCFLRSESRIIVTTKYCCQKHKFIPSLQITERYIYNRNCSKKTPFLSKLLRLPPPCPTH